MGLIASSRPRLQGYVFSAIDTTPDAFTFTDQTNVSTSQTITSAAITVSGINSGATITVTGGTYDINSSGSFTSSSGTVNNGDTVRARHTSSGSNSTAVNTVVTIGGVSDTFTSTTSSGSSGVFFQPDLGSFTTPQQVFTQDVNSYDGGSVTLSTAKLRPGGQSKAIRLEYTQDESGVELKPPAFANTASLFVRHYVCFDTGWATRWPVGCKTSRFFSRNDFSTGPGEPNDWAYISEKLIWQTYAGDPDDNYAKGYNNAIYDLDLEGTYGSGVNFGNGLPYIRENVWYKWERWYVINSAPDVADGIMQVWIDDQLVCNRTNVPYKSTTRGCPNGSGWQSMWFGGNYSGATFGGPGQTLHRYEDGYYLSTTLDRPI